MSDMIFEVGGEGGGNFSSLLGGQDRGGALMRVCGGKGCWQKARSEGEKKIRQRFETSSSSSHIFHCQ